MKSALSWRWIREGLWTNTVVEVNENLILMRVDSMLIETPDGKHYYQVSVDHEAIGPFCEEFTSFHDTRAKAEVVIKEIVRRYLEQ